MSGRVCAFAAIARESKRQALTNRCNMMFTVSVFGPGFLHSTTLVRKTPATNRHNYVRLWPTVATKMKRRIANTLAIAASEGNECAWPSPCR